MAKLATIAVAKGLAILLALVLFSLLRHH